MKNKLWNKPYWVKHSILLRSACIFHIEIFELIFILYNAMGLNPFWSSLSILRYLISVDIHETSILRQYSKKKNYICRKNNSTITVTLKNISTHCEIVLLCRISVWDRWHSRPISFYLAWRKIFKMVTRVHVRKISFSKVLLLVYSFPVLCKSAESAEEILENQTQ